jgi:hypothetical protein
MTGRQLIDRIVKTCQDLDAEVPLFTLERDEHGGVTDNRQHTLYSFINGKLLVEQNYDERFAFSNRKIPKEDH